MRLRSQVVCALATALLIGVELAYFSPVQGAARHWAGRIWVGAAVVVLLGAALEAVAIYFERSFWRERGVIWFLVAAILPPALILADAGGIMFTSIDAEGVLHLVAGQQLLHTDPALGIFRIEATYYIAREYLLESLPTVLWGPSLWMARLGNSYLYILAYWYFLAALGRYFRFKKVADALLLAAWCGLTITLGGYALLMARKFEQTMAPTAVAMIFFGALLLYLVRPRPARIIVAAWAFGFMADSYTPALAAWGLAAGILGYALWKREWLLAPALLYGLVALTVAVRIRTANPALNTFRLGVTEFTALDWIARYGNAAPAIWGPERALLPAPLFLALVATLGTWWRRREWGFFLVVAWAVGAMAASVTFIGSYLNSAAFDTHRSMIVLAPLALAAVWAGAFQHHPDHWLAIRREGASFWKVSLIYMVATAGLLPFTQRNFSGMNASTDWDECLQTIAHLHQRPPPERPRVIYLVPPLDLPVDRCTEYFSPGTEVRRGVVAPENRQPGTYAIRFRYPNHNERYRNENIPSLNPRPYLLVERAWDDRPLPH